MTPTSFKRAAYGLVGLSLAFVLLSVQGSSSGKPAAMQPAAPLASPTVPPDQKPTLPRYNCGDSQSPDYITFNWTGTKPNGGWVGDVTYNGKKTLIQAFDAKYIGAPTDKLVDWGFQAQNGSFVCRMKVNSKVPLLRNASVSFDTCNNNNWPQLACSLKAE
jgi:hypothetical protein